jgi:predicted amidophosphoribosyltransferase
MAGREFLPRKVIVLESFPMNCPGCNRPLAAGETECPHCGQAVCADCGAPLHPSLTACPQCGASYDFFCTECNAMVPPDAAVCPECGAEFEDSGDGWPAPADGDATRAPFTGRCPACGLPVYIEDGFCNECGQPFCPSCGAAVDDADDRCPLCHTELFFHCPLCHLELLAAAPICPQCDAFFPRRCATCGSLILGAPGSLLVSCCLY